VVKTAIKSYFSFSPVSLVLLLAGVSLGLDSFGDAYGQNKNAAKVAPLSAPLEIRLPLPVRWENGCLVVSLDRTNRTSSPLFLPHRDVDIYTSVQELPDAQGNKKGVEWINVVGLSDILSWEATPIAPGETVHKKYCLSPTVAVVHQQKKTHRELQLRGKLRIDAYYFLTEKDWLTNKAQHEAMLRMSEDELRRMEVLYPKVSTVEVAIPCRANDCASQCDKPAALLYGEMRVVPDIYSFHPDWKERGRAINDELARKSQPCSRY